MYNSHWLHLIFPLIGTINRSDAVEEELKRFSKVMEEKEKSLTKERDELKALVKQLKELTRNQKRRIEDLIDMNNQQELLLKSQKLALESKVSSHLSIYVFKYLTQYCKKWYS